MDELKEGDVVQLRSGSPRMTILEIGDYSVSSDGKLSAKCTWFEGAKPHTDVFPLHALIRY